MSFNSLPLSPPKILVEVCGPALAVAEPATATVYTHDPATLARVPNTVYNVCDNSSQRFMVAHKTQLATLDTANVLRLATFDMEKKRDHFGHVAEWKLPKTETFTCVCWNHDGTALVLATTNGTLYRVNTKTHQIDPFGATVGGAVTSLSAAPCGNNIFAVAHKSGTISIIRIANVLEIYHTFKLSSRTSGGEPNKEREPTDTALTYALTTSWHYSSRDPSNQSLAAIDSNNRVQVWSVSIKSLVRKIRCFGLPEGAASASPIWWTKGGSLFHALNDSRVCIHNVKTSKVSTRVISTGNVISCTIKSSRGKAWLATTSGIEFLDLVGGAKKRGSESSQSSGDSEPQSTQQEKDTVESGEPPVEVLLSPPRPIARRSPLIPVPTEAPPPIPQPPQLPMLPPQLAVPPITLLSAQPESWDDDSDVPSSAFSNTRSSNTSADTCGGSEFEVPIKPLLNCRPKTRFSGNTTPTSATRNDAPIDTSRISLFHIDMSVSDPTAEKALSPNLSWESQALRVLFDWESSCYELIQSQRTDENTIANYYLGQWLNDSEYTANIEVLESTLSPTQSTALLCLSLLDREPAKVDKTISLHIGRVRRRLPSAALDTHYVCTTLLSLGLAHQAIYVYQQLGFYMEAVILGILYAQSIEETLDLWMYSAASSDVWSDGVVHRCSVLMSLVNPQASYPVAFEDRDVSGALLPPGLRKLSLEDLLKSSQGNNFALDSPSLPAEDLSVGIDSPTLGPIDFDFNKPPNFSRRGRTPKTSPNLV